MLEFASNLDLFFLYRECNMLQFYRFHFWLVPIYLCLKSDRLNHCISGVLLTEARFLLILTQKITNKSPDNATLIADSWIGLGFSHPFSNIAIKSGRFKQNSSKSIPFVRVTSCNY